MPHPKQNDDPVLDNSPNGPIRQCALSRERLAQTEMIRFARAPDGMITPDVAAKLPGRGVWVKANRETVEAAIAKGAFSRGFKAQAQPPDGLTDLIEILLVKRLQGVLGMAKRAGRIVLGYPAMKLDQFITASQNWRRLPRLFADVRGLKKAVPLDDQDD